LDVETAFTRVFGRPPMPAEQSQLDGWRAAWNIRGNEVLVAVAMLVCRTQPEREDLLGRCAAAVRAALDAASHEPRGKLPAGPAEAAAPEPSALRTVAGVAAALSWVGVAVACLAAGASSAGRWHGPAQPPEWLQPNALVPVVTAPCGWTVFVALATPAAYAAGWAWALARGRDPGRRKLGRGVLVAIGCVASAWVAGLLLLL
jgi:hypothetical protein